MIVTRTLRLVAAALATVGAFGVAAATPAAAMPTYAGVANAEGGLTLRVGPTTHGESRGTIAQGQRFAIQCRVDASTVDGITTWYAAPDFGPTWVSGRYVDLVGSSSVRYCGDGSYHRASSTAALNERDGASSKDATARTVRAGAALNLVCFTDGQKIVGTYRWYNLDNGAWVSAAYVKGAGTTPVCA